MCDDRDNLYLMGQRIAHYSELTLPLTELLKKNKPYIWCDKAENSFVELKSRMASRPILCPPDYNQWFWRSQWLAGQ